LNGCPSAKPIIPKHNILIQHIRQESGWLLNWRPQQVCDSEDFPSPLIDRIHAGLGYECAPSAVAQLLSEAMSPIQIPWGMPFRVVPPNACDGRIAV
jgi:hypothetical protein